MARLKFRATVQGQNAPGNDITSISRYIYLEIFPTAGNVFGTPECRIGPSGPWLSMPVDGFGNYRRNFENLTVATHDIYFRDARGERMIFSAPILSYAGSCFAGTGAITVPSIITVNELSISVASGSSSGSGIYPFEYSITTGCGSGYQSSGVFSAPVGTTSINTVCRRTSSLCPSPMVTSLYLVQFPTVDASFIKTDVTINGGSNGTIDVTPTGGNGTFTYLWNDGVTTQDRTGLVAGTYSVTITSDGQTKSLAVVISEPAILSATFTQSNATTTGGADGSIAVSPAGGSGSYAITWNDSGSTSFTRTGLVAGLYLAEITDLITAETVALEITITDPALVIIPGTFVRVPMMNSFRFVRRVSPNQCSVFQNFDNTLLCEETHPYFVHTNYFQKVAKCDVIPIQWFSDYDQFNVELISYETGLVVKTFIPELKQQNIGVEEQYPLTIRNNGSSQSRIYFGTGQIPIPLEAGDTFEIINNVDGFNGSYAIVSIQADVLLGSQYLVINKNYVIGSPSSSATGKFATNVVDFDVYEAVCSFGDVANGSYQMRIKGFDDDESNFDEWISEPILLDTNHPDTNLIEYRCNDNAFDVVWTTGITARVRVESHLQKRFVGGVRSVSRNCDHSLVKTAAKKTRRPLLEFYQIPPYLYEKLAVVFDCDVIRVNDVTYQTDADVEKPRYVTRYQLCNTSIEIEQVGWFTSQNSHDIGNVDGDTGFIIANEGFLKR